MADSLNITNLSRRSILGTGIAAAGALAVAAVPIANDRGGALALPRYRFAEQPKPNKGVTKVKEGTDNKGNGKNVVPFAKPERKAKPRRPMTLKEALMASLNTDEENQAEYFDECYARVLRIQARIIDNSREPACDEQENRLGKLQDRESAALWDVIHARGIHRWQIAHKLELLEELLHTGQNWFISASFSCSTAPALICNTLTGVQKLWKQWGSARRRRAHSCLVPAGKVREGSGSPRPLFSLGWLGTLVICQLMCGQVGTFLKPCGS